MKTFFRLLNIIMGCVNLIVLLLVLVIATLIIWDNHKPQVERRYPLSSEAFVDEFHDFDWVFKSNIDSYHISVDDYREYKYDVGISFRVDTITCHYLFHKGVDEWQFTEKHTHFYDKDTLMMQLLQMSPEEYNKCLLDICYFALALNQKYQITNIVYRNPNNYDRHPGHVFRRRFHSQLEDDELIIVKAPFPVTEEFKQRQKDRYRKFDVWFYEEQEK